MKVGVPKEVKNHEYRVAITPIGVHELVAHGHEVFIETGRRGRARPSPTRSTSRAGATIVATAEEAWGTDGGVDMVLKVKEPVAEEYHRMREGLTLFTYLHLAADKPLTEELINRKVTGIAYETVQLPSGGLPLLYPMSEVAGCLAPQVGAHALLKAQGGRGVLMGGVGGVANAKVVIIGAGVSGQNAANIALGMGADVTLLDTDLDKLRMSFWRYNNRVHGLASSKLAIEQQVTEADMVIGAVLIPGAAAPKLVTQRPGLADEAGLGAGRHRGRPGRLLRGHPRDHARRPDVPGAQLDLLLRGEHARRGAEHLDVRPDQRDPAVRRGAGRQGLGAGLPRRPQPRAGPQHPRRPAHQRPGRRGGRHRRRRRWSACSADAEPADSADPARGRSAPTSTTSPSSAGWRPTPCTSYRRDLRRYLELLARPGVDDLDDGHRGDRDRLPGRGCARATPTTRR